jgi:hypothetical protein
VDLWKYKQPKKGETSKKVGDKMYYWCPNHEAWCIHKLSECLLQAPKDKNIEANTTIASEEEEQLTMIKALQAIADDADEAEEADDA